MEVKDAPPKTDMPNAGDGAGNIKIVIEAISSINPGMQVLPDLRKAFDEIGTPLLGATAMKRICSCGNCPGTIYGLILARNEQAIVNVGLFYVAIGGMDIRDTNDPDLKIGSFDEIVDNGTTDWRDAP